MRTCWLGLIGGFLLLVGAHPVGAQSSAGAFFHEAAQQYVTGDVAAARQTVERGLEVAPSDPRLQALLETLKQQDEKGGRGGSSQSGQQGQSSGEQSEGEKAQGDRSSRSQRQGQSRSEEGRPSDRSAQPAGRDPSASARPKGGSQKRRSGDRQGRRGQPANVLSRAQAERLLRALENQEKRLLREIRVRTGEERTVEKDW